MSRAESRYSLCSLQLRVETLAECVCKPLAWAGRSTLFVTAVESSACGAGRWIASRPVFPENEWKISGSECRPLAWHLQTRRPIDGRTRTAVSAGHDDGGQIATCSFASPLMLLICLPAVPKQESGRIRGSGLFIAGGRAPESLRYNVDLLKVTLHFFEAGKPVGSVCRGIEIIA